MLPLVAICGTTGVGKSKLAVELALRLSKPVHGRPWNGARIINADAMQVYKGFNVITNKLAAPERHGVEHLLMDFMEPDEQYVVGEWVRDAMRAIDETHERNQIPIVVGGTSYWIQHLIFPNRLASSSNSASEPKMPPPMSHQLADTLATLSPEQIDVFQNLPQPPPSASESPEAALSLYNLLMALDPLVAARWHWRDTRKVLRSLEIIRDSGRRASELFKDQEQQKSSSRYRILCFWLYADPASLNPRIDARVDEMLQHGVLDEVRQMRDIASSKSFTRTPLRGEEETRSIDSTLGVFQSIGFKELDQYLGYRDPTERLLNSAVEDMKRSTRKYAKRQVSWIRNKLLPALYASKSSAADAGTETSNAYLLDATELGDKWATNVRDPAINITEGFLRREALPDPLSLSENASQMLSIDLKPTDPTAVLAARRKIICPVCSLNPAQPVMIEKGSQWDTHQRTKTHRRLASNGRNTILTHRPERVQDSTRSPDEVTDDEDEPQWTHSLFEGAHDQD